ncbi:MAG: MMPL family transporter [Pirellulaceae bacterium]|nr:MMPL family transporter [Pirellulaceae bacterium]
MMQRLEFSTKRTALLGPGSESQQDWLDFTHQFDATDNVLVVVEGSDPSMICDALDDIGQQLLEQPDLFRNVHYKIATAQFSRKGLYYLSVAERNSLEESLIQAIPLLTHEAESANAQLFWQLVTVAATTPDQYESPWPFAKIAHDLQARLLTYTLSNDNKRGLIAFHLVNPAQQFASGQQSITKLRKIAMTTSKKHSGIEIGVTGLPVIEFDEMSTSEADMTKASIVSLVLVSLLFWAGFGKLRYPAFAITALLVGITWTCGYLTLTLGRLSILSVSFGVILSGLELTSRFITSLATSRCGGLTKTHQPPCCKPH